MPDEKEKLTQGVPAVDDANNFGDVSTPNALPTAVKRMQCENNVVDIFPVGSFEGRGVYVPEGMSAAEIMIGAAALERKFDVAPYISREMVRAVLAAIAEARLGLVLFNK